MKELNLKSKQTEEQKIIEGVPTRIEKLKIKNILLTDEIAQLEKRGKGLIDRQTGGETNRQTVRDTT